MGGININKILPTPSKGEQKIIDILESSHIQYEREKTFYTVRVNRYRFDFYLTQLNILIEFDGIHHFTQIKQFHPTRKDFLKAQERDRIKNAYALAHNIKLYRIPYWELENIKDINDIINDKYLVTTKFHNDGLTPPKF